MAISKDIGAVTKSVLSLAALAVIGVLIYEAVDSFTAGAQGNGFADLTDWLYATFGIGTPSPQYVTAQGANGVINALEQTITGQQAALDNLTGSSPSAVYSDNATPVTTGPYEGQDGMSLIDNIWNDFVSPGNIAASTAASGTSWWNS